MSQQNCHKRVGNYIFLNPIGRGAFAEVYKGRDQTTHEDVAIKMMSRAKVKDEEFQIEKEIRILKELNHENIVKLHNYQKTSNHYYLVFEFCKHGDLEHFIKDCYLGRVSEFEAQKFVQQIIEGIKAMRTKNIVHRDLKLANILVSKDFVLKIADFGLARSIENDNYLLKTMVGTPLNMDPAILERKSYNEKCDIWSLGVIFYQMLVGQAPYHPGRGAGIDDLIELIKKKPLSFPSDIPLSDSVKTLIRSMLVYDVNKRMGFEELFNNEWVTGKYIVQNPANIPEVPDLSATQLLQSMYDKKKTESQTKKTRKDSMKGLTLENDKADMVKPEMPKDLVSLVSNLSPKDLELESVPESERHKELYGAAFLAKVYEIFRQKISLLREYAVKAQNMNFAFETTEDDKAGIVQVLISLDMLRIMREVLSAKFSIINEENEDAIFNNDFVSFWEFVMNNQKAIENFLSTHDAVLELTDLHQNVKSDYISMFEGMSKKLENVKEAFEQSKGYNLDKLLMDCLIKLSEDSAYQEYLEENVEKKIDNYNTCLQICEFLLFRRRYKFTEFKFVERSAEGAEERKDNHVNKLSQYVSENFQSGFNFKHLKRMSEKSEYKKLFNQIKDKIVVVDSEQTEGSEQDFPLEKFKVLVSRRIKDLKGKVEIDFNL